MNNIQNIIQNNIRNITWSLSGNQIDRAEILKGEVVRKTQFNEALVGKVIWTNYRSRGNLLLKVPVWDHRGEHSLSLVDDKLVFTGSALSFNGIDVSLCIIAIFGHRAMDYSKIHSHLTMNGPGEWVDSYERVLCKYTDQQLYDKHMSQRGNTYLGYDEETKTFNKPSELYLKIVTEFFTRYPSLLKEQKTKNKEWLISQYGQIVLDMAHMFKRVYEFYVAPERV